MVSSDKNGKNRVPIYSSIDLQSWKFEKFVFNSENLPKWIKDDENLFYGTPEISYCDGAYTVYFTAPNKNGKLCIGVASSKSIGGSFVEIGQPLLESPENLHTPHIVKIGKYLP